MSSTSSKRTVPDDTSSQAKRARISSSSSNTNGGLTTSIPEGNLLFAVPKKGRLYDRVLKLLTGMGVIFRRKARLDIANSSNMPITLIFLNAHDIAVFVSKGDVDLGITGQDIVAETKSTVTVEKKMNIGQCKLALQAPRDECHKDPKSFAGKRVVTSFPNLAKQYFAKFDAELGVETSIQYVSGSVEAACGLGLADCVVDLVETGTTMRAAGLDVVDYIMTTETVLVSNPNSKYKKLIKQLSSRLTGYQMANSYNMVTYNIERTKVPQASAITPGVQAPTVIALQQEGWVAIQAMVPSKNVPRVMEDLRTLGATGIIAMSIANCRMD